MVLVWFGMGVSGEWFWVDRVYDSKFNHFPQKFILKF